MISKTKKITINGAGLIGPYLGILLRRRGFDVEVWKNDLTFEK